MQGKMFGIRALCSRIPEFLKKVLREKGKDSCSRLPTRRTDRNNGEDGERGRPERAGSFERWDGDAGCGLERWKKLRKNHWRRKRKSSLLAPFPQWGSSLKFTLCDWLGPPIKKLYRKHRLAGNTVNHSSSWITRFRTLLSESLILAQNERWRRG